MKANRQSGFSLVELMIVVAIVGVLAAIAIPSYFGIQKKGKRVEYKTNLEVLRLLEEKYRAENGAYVEGLNTADLMTLLPEFRPGDPAELMYDYTVVYDAGDTQTFIATASGNSHGPDQGKKFCVNQDNEHETDANCP